MRRSSALPRSSPEATGQYEPQLLHNTAGMGLFADSSIAMLPIGKVVRAMLI